MSPEEVDAETNKFLEPTGWTIEEWTRKAHERMDRRLAEATEYDSKFSQLMAGGLGGVEQAFQLADAMGIPTQELPWTLQTVSRYVDAKGYEDYPDGGWAQHHEELLEPTGWSLEKWREELRKREEDIENTWDNMTADQFNAEMERRKSRQ